MLIPILALAIMPSQPYENWIEGAHLYRSCQAWVRVADAKMDADIAKDLNDETFCVAYIAGFVDGTGTTSRGACFPSKLSVEQVVRPYVAYMLTHPEAMHVDRRIGLVLALADGFPCPAK